MRSLIDPQKRAAYDRYGHAAFQQGGFGGAGGGFHDPFDLFREVFGTSRRGGWNFRAFFWRRADRWFGAPARLRFALRHADYLGGGCRAAAKRKSRFANWTLARHAKVRERKRVLMRSLARFAAGADRSSRRAVSSRSRRRVRTARARAGSSKNRAARAMAMAGWSALLA